MTILKDLIIIFGALTGRPYKPFLINSKFRKLAYMSFMKNSKFGKHDYDILYKKIIKISETGQMDFYGFVNAIEIICSKLHPTSYKEDKVEVMCNIIELLKSELNVI